VYTIWRVTGEFIYVGMSANLRERLNAHASGRRSGDQFCVYVCDRFVVPALTFGQQAEVGRGELSLDRLTREYVRQQLTYRRVECPDVPVARALGAGGQDGRADRWATIPQATSWSVGIP
jgi:predicted GIY-YIG superfamily endonuclease